MVDKIIGDEIKEMDKFLDSIKEKDNFSDEELEKIILRLTLLMYYAVDRLESLGIKSDVSEINNNETYSRYYLQGEGTIPERDNQAELDSLEEELMEKAYYRAYKKLKGKIDAAEKVYRGVKKVMDKRKAEIDFNRSAEQ